ncbi:TonB-dependent receptor [Sphingomonas oleivorans]|nr:TonB-dependent receptor [Sphingomonas oleivorans]
MPKGMERPGAVLAILTALSCANQAHAQDKKSTEPGLDKPALEEIIVTATVGASKISQFETSYAVSSFGEKDLARVAPLSTVDLFSEIPGFWAESSGGEGANNLFVRGLPLAGAFKYSPLLEDGLPVFEEPEIGFMNADILLKLDSMTERVEFVRGGPSFIVHSNAVGGAVNAITRKGTKKFQGQAKFTYGDYDHYRGEGYISGPISDTLSYSIGGFYRIDDGIRDPGFTANKGGQIRGTLSFRNDRTEVHLTAKYTNDRNIFYLPIPVVNPKDPKGIPGIDANYGTLTSADFKVVNIKTPDGIVTKDLEDGIHPEFKTFTALLTHEFGGGWIMQNKLRYVDGKNGFNGIFPRTDPFAARNFLDIFLPKMQAAFPSVQKLEYRYTNHPDIGFDIANQNNNGLVNGAGWWFANIEVDDNIIEEFSLTKQIGNHDITAGLYYSHYGLKSFISFNDILTDVRDRPRLLDVVGLDAAGNVVGRLTDNGFLRYGGFTVSTSDKVETKAFFINDNWQINDRLRVDFGLRMQGVDIDSNTADLDFAGVNLGDPTTLADDSSVWPTGTISNNKGEFSDTGWTLGANYELSGNLAVYARYTDSFRLPRSETLWFGGKANINYVKQYEAGLKVRTDNLTIFAAAFYNKFKGLPLSTQEIDPITRDVKIINFVAGSETLGLEVETDWRPFGRNFGVHVAGTLQDPKFLGTTFNTVINPDTGETVTTDYSGNQINRIPKVMLNVNPYLDFRFGSIGGQLYGSFKHVGKRFADFASTVEIHSYETFELGAFLDVTEKLRLQVHISNLTNSTGLTEANHNTGSVVNGQQIIFGRPEMGRAVRLSATYSF